MNTLDDNNTNKTTTTIHRRQLNNLRKTTKNKTCTKGKHQGSTVYSS